MTKQYGVKVLVHAQTHAAKVCLAYEIMASQFERLDELDRAGQCRRIARDYDDAWHTMNDLIKVLMDEDSAQ